MGQAWEARGSEEDHTENDLLRPQDRSQHWRRCLRISASEAARVPCAQSVKEASLFQSSIVGDPLTHVLLNKLT